MGLVNVDIDLLRTLTVVVETGSFTKAGERLLRTQSAISLQIRKLESLVGQQLLERGREIRPTPAGEMACRYARSILKLNDALVADMTRRDEPAVIRIGTPDDYASLILPRAIRVFSQYQREVEIRVVSDLSANLCRLVERGELDLAFVTGGPGVDGMELAAEPLVWISGRTAPRRIDDPVPLALFPQGCRLREIALAALDAAGRRWRVAYSSNLFGPLHALLAQGEAVGILPARAVPGDLATLGEDSGLPPLPSVPLVIKLGPSASDTVCRLAAVLARVA